MVDQTGARAPEHSQVVVFPPVIPLSGFLLGVVLEMIWPTGPFVNHSLRMDLRAIGTGLLCLGAAGFLWMVVTMKRVGTPIHNSSTPTALSKPVRFVSHATPCTCLGRRRTRGSRCY
jgi:protein-S-isoprenylcysteine O-methyltransferase Ste14